MLGREDFVFTIGYDGAAAVVDRHAKKRYSSLSSRELAQKGLFRAAYSSAVWSKEPKELEEVLEIYNKVSGQSVRTDSSHDRLFGVFPVDVKRTVLI
jgi:hypothetical protein